MENSLYGRKAVYEYNRIKNKGEVKFHIKPTQVNRKNPVLVINCYPVVRRWMYELNNGYFVIFSVYDDSRSEAVVANCPENSGEVYYLDHTMVDIHTKKDLVDFVTDYNKYSNFDMVDIDY
jgi:hypothetical protein